MIDAGFPIIFYPRQMPERDRGRSHGESYRQAIGELCQIRRDLMRRKNPGLTAAKIESLAAEQWLQTRNFDRGIADEMEGIAEGAKLSIDDLVILNNYTDFRDIQVPEEGCSVVYVNRTSPIAAQTWDMHASAKNYVCCIQIQANDPHDEQVIFSLVGCVGLMGYSRRGLAVGVNNINTSGARPGLIWPALIRKMLLQSNFSEMRHELVAANVTSGHTYLLASAREAEFWEVMPGLAEPISRVESPQTGHLFHTNHCLGSRARLRELPAAINSTTRIRYQLLEQKISAVSSMDEVYALLNDHENYPQAICSNYQSGDQDPSVTCGGAAGDLESGKVVMWRGDAMYDSNFVRHTFELEPIRGG